MSAARSGGQDRGGGLVRRATLALAVSAAYGPDVLETGRLTLRQFTPDDIENLVELDGDPEVMRYINGGRATPRTVFAAVPSS